MGVGRTGENGQALVHVIGPAAVVYRVEAEQGIVPIQRQPEVG